MDCDIKNEPPWGPCTMLPSERNYWDGDVKVEPPELKPFSGSDACDIDTPEQYISGLVLSVEQCDSYVETDGDTAIVSEHLAIPDETLAFEPKVEPHQRDPSASDSLNVFNVFNAHESSKNDSYSRTAQVSIHKRVHSNASAKNKVARKKKTREAPDLELDLNDGTVSTSEEPPDAFTTTAESAGQLTVCPICTREFTSQKTLANHLKRSHTDDTRRFPCSFCAKAFKTSTHLRVHVRVHTGERPYVCSFCAKPFTVKHNLDMHLRIHTGEKPYACFVCSKAFSVKHCLDAHLKRHSGEKLFKCPLCGWDFIYKHSLKLHMRTHTGEKPYACSSCGRAFALKTTLVKHKRIHTGEKPYECPLCAKTFAQSANFIHHKKTHSAVASEMEEESESARKSSLATRLRHSRPFICSFCGDSFTKKSSLVRHERSHTGEKPFACSQCGMEFAENYFLVNHERTHLDIAADRPYVCSSCGNAFKTKFRLKSHIRTHTGERPYSCSFCSKAFALKSTMTRHERTHSEGNPLGKRYVCSFCGEAFKSSSGLSRHKKRTHKERLSVP